MHRFLERNGRQAANIDDLLSQKLQTFKNGYRKSGIRGEQNWNIFPSSSSDNTNETLRQLLRYIITQFPQTPKTFIGRAFPQGSHLELRKAQADDQRTLSEVGHIPLWDEQFQIPSGTVLVPTLRLELKKSYSYEGDPQEIEHPIGMYERAGQPPLGEYQPDITQNVVLSYRMIDADYLKNTVERLSSHQDSAMASLNTPGQAILSIPTVPPAPSDLQSLLKAASQASPMVLG